MGKNGYLWGPAPKIPPQNKWTGLRLKDEDFVYKLI